MATVFRPTTPDDASALTALMSTAFSVQADDRMLAPDLMHWKFWSAREDFTEPRSYAMERNGNVVAHAGIWPMTVHTEVGTFRGCHMVDWAADTRVPGVGAAFLQKFSALFDFVYAIAYSDMAHKVLTGFGFVANAENWVGARPLRPLQQMRTHQFKDWRMPIRLVRNTFWSLVPALDVPRPWSVGAGMREFDGVERPCTATLQAARPQAFFEYLATCPTVRFRVFEIHRDGQVAGRIALSHVDGQARVAGVWLTEQTPENLRTAFLLAQEAALQVDTASELLVHGSAPEAEQAAVAAGVRIVKRKPILWLSKNPNLPVRPFAFQMIDSDAMWLSDGTSGYMT